MVGEEVVKFTAKGRFFAENSERVPLNSLQKGVFSQKTVNSSREIHCKMAFLREKQ